MRSFTEIENEKKLENKLKNALVIHEGNTKKISTRTVTLCLIKLIDVRKNTTNEHRILYKRTWDFIQNFILISNWMRKRK